MAKFRDRAGRLWLIAASGDRLRDVRKQLGVDLRKPSAFDRLDEMTAAAVLFEYCKPEATAYQMNRADFDRLFAGEKLEIALREIQEEMGQTR